MLRFEASVDGIEVLDRAFNRTDGYLSDMRNFAPAVSEEFYRSEHEQFSSEGSRGASGKFKPLSTAYAKYKAQKFPGETILRATGHLEESLTNRDALDAIFIVDKDELILGSKVPYAVLHQRGTGRMPSRPPISLSEIQKRNMQKAIQVQLVEFTRKLGFQVEENAA